MYKYINIFIHIIIRNLNLLSKLFVVSNNFEGKPLPRRGAPKGMPAGRG